MSESVIDAANAILDYLKATGYTDNTYPAGTGQLLAEVGLATDTGREAIRLLKSYTRITQVGKGKGNSVIINSFEKLIEEAIVNVDTSLSQPMVLDDDFDSLIAHIQKYGYHIQKDLEDAQRRVYQLEQELVQKDNRISELESKSQSFTMTSWA